MRLYYLPLFILLLAVASSVCAKQRSHIEVDDIESWLNDDVYMVRGDVTIDLVNPILEALDNGVTLEFALYYDILRSNRWWLDKSIAKISQRYQVSYHALSRQYLLTNLNTRSVNTYYSLELLLDDMGQIRDFPLIDKSLLEPGALYIVRMRAYLDYDELPIPLRIRAYSSLSWRPGSDWILWPLR